MKKISIMLLATLMLFAFVACNPEGKDTREPEEIVTYVDNGTTDYLSYKVLSGKYWEEPWTSNTLADLTLTDDGKLQFATGFGLYINHKNASDDIITAEKGDKFTLTFDVDDSALTGNDNYFLMGIGAYDSSLKGIDNAVKNMLKVSNNSSVKVVVEVFKDKGMKITLNDDANTSVTTDSTNATVAQIIAATKTFDKTNGQVVVSNIKLVRESDKVGNYSAE